MTALRLVLAAAVLGLFLSAPPSAAAAPAPAAGPVVARGDYWRGFTEFWTGRIQRTSGVVLIALGAGAVGIFIITRGKWRK